MPHHHDTLLVLGEHDLDRIRREGRIGASDWSAAKLRHIRRVVLCRDGEDAAPDAWPRPEIERHAGWLIGLVDRFETVAEADGRTLRAARISAYALIDAPDLWPHRDRRDRDYVHFAELGLEEPEVWTAMTPPEVAPLRLVPAEPTAAEAPPTGLMRWSRRGAAARC